jgi:hypothetical protein
VIGGQQYNPWDVGRLFGGGFAKGGLVHSKHYLVDAQTGAVAGMVGEDGTEAIFPLSERHDDRHVASRVWGRETAEQLGTRTAVRFLGPPVPRRGGGDGAGGDLHVHLHDALVVGSSLDRAARELSEPLRRELLRTQRRNGTTGIT